MAQQWRNVNVVTSEIVFGFSAHADVDEESVPSLKSLTLVNEK